jgi:Ser/Thr protein kinase RdoA (MazF antagonist)
MELPPLEVLERGGIDPSTLERLDWPFPIWTCAIDGERVVVASKRGRTDRSLDWEAALLDGLEAAGFPACRTARIFDGCDYTVTGGLHYVARSWLPGRMLVEMDGPDLYAVGRFMARYHTVAATIGLPQRDGVTPLEDVLPSVDDDAMSRVLGDPSLVRRYRELVDAVLPSVAGADTSLPIHGDFTTRNVAAWGPSTFTGLIDFGMAHAGCPAIELAYALGSARPTFDHVEHVLDAVTMLVLGYCSLRPLDVSDPSRIVDFARSRPLLGLAIYAIEGFDPPGATRVAGSFGRADWLTAHREEMIAAIERGITTA